MQLGERRAMQPQASAEKLQQDRHLPRRRQGIRRDLVGWPGLDERRADKTWVHAGEDVLLVGVDGDAVDKEIRPAFERVGPVEIVPVYYFGVKVREVIRLLENDGWYLALTKGSHRQFKHPTKRGTVTLSGKTGVDVPPGTLNSILKQAGLK